MQRASRMNANCVNTRVKSNKKITRVGKGIKEGIKNPNIHKKN